MRLLYAILIGAIVGPVVNKGDEVGAIPLLSSYLQFETVFSSAAWRASEYVVVLNPSPQQDSLPSGGGVFGIPPRNVDRWSTYELIRTNENFAAAITSPVWKIESIRYPVIEDLPTTMGNSMFGGRCASIYPGDLNFQESNLAGVELLTSYLFDVDVCAKFSFGGLLRLGKNFVAFGDCQLGRLGAALSGDRGAGRGKQGEQQPDNPEPSWWDSGGLRARAVFGVAAGLIAVGLVLWGSWWGGNRRSRVGYVLFGFAGLD